jgi:hypothetical protein
VSAETPQDFAADPVWAEEQLTETFDELARQVIATDEVAEALHDPALAGFGIEAALATHKEEILLGPAAELSALAEATAALEAARVALRETAGSEQPPPRSALPEAGSGLAGLVHRVLRWLRDRWAMLRGRPPAPPPPPPGPRVAKSAPGSIGVEKARSDLGLDALESRRDVAARKYTEAVSTRAMSRMVRTLISAEREASYATTLTITSAPGLAELALDDLEVATSASDALARLLKSMLGGSIGIAGPRGVGKTTLIRAFHLGRHRPSRESDRQQLSVMVAAPVVYEGRDFVLHLFNEICRAVLKSRSGQIKSRVADSTQPEARLVVRAVLRLVLSAVLLSAVPAGIAIALLAALVSQARFEDLVPGVLALAGALAAAVLYRRARSLPRARALVVRAWAASIAVGAALAGATLIALALADASVEPAVLWGGALALTAATLGTAAGRAARTSELAALSAPEASQDDLETIASRWRDTIRYQQTFTSGWSGSLRLPLGLEGGLTGSNQLAEQPMTFPQVVEELRGFLRGAGVSRDVLIAIDELDKMESEEAAGRFLNEIKGIFGIEHCFYLVSVSEDAMSRFERRGLPLRDEFDSSFDEILHMRYLTLDESRHVLRERVIGLPVPFLLLAHCMSGGLPRDLIRVARTLVDINAGQGGGGSLDDLCSRLVALELERKVRAARVAARGIGTEPHASCFLGWSEQLEVEEPKAKELFDFAADVDRFVAQEMPCFKRTDGEDPYSIQRGDREKLIDLAIELGALAYFFGTILDGFTADAGQHYFRDLERRPEGCPASETLAGARQEFATNRRAAWRLISEFREMQGRAKVEHPELWAPAYEPEATAPLP